MLGLNLYYKDLYTTQEKCLYYQDLMCNTLDEVKVRHFYETWKMWSETFNKLDNLKWYQKLFYKRES